MEGEPPPNLENYAVLQGKMGSKMYFSRESTGQRTIGELLLLKKTVTDIKPLQGNLTAPQKFTSLVTKDNESCS